LKVTYTEEAVADIIEAITYLNERSSHGSREARCRDRAVHRTFGRSGA